MPESRYVLHGLCIESSIALGPPARSGATPELSVTVVPPCPVPMGAPPGELLVGLAVGDRPLHTGARDASGYLLRVHGLCDFVVSPDFRTVECRPDPVCSLEEIVLLLRGPVLSFVLGIAGECCLHASAVQLPDADEVVAFVGPRSGGKSSVAALACAAGARFVVDDLLRLDRQRPGGWIGTSAELRLRPHSDGALEQVSHGWDPRPTVDGRIAVTPPKTPLQSGPLAAVVVVRLSSTAQAVAMERLSAPDAVVALSAYPRLAVWRAPSVLESQFLALSELAAVIPVAVATIPWRSPVGPDLGAAVIEALREMNSPRTSVAS